MKNRRLVILHTCVTMMLFLLTIQVTYAQCPDDNNLANNDTLSSTTPFNRDATNFFPGYYALAKVVQGESYAIGTCFSFFNQDDINMTLYSHEDGSFQGYNDNFCGLLPELIYTATYTGLLRILIDGEGCTDPAPPLAEGGPDQGNEQEGYSYNVDITLLPSAYKPYQGIAVDDFVLKFLSTEDTVISILSDQGFFELQRDTTLNTMGFTFTLEELELEFEARFFHLDIIADIANWKVILRNPDFDHLD